MPRSSSKTTEPLTTPVQFLKGVGPERAELVAKIGLKTVRDVLFYFPRSYEDLSHVTPIADLEEGVAVSLEGVVDEVDLRSRGIGKSVLGVLIRSDEMYLRATWFNQPYLREKFQAGQRVLLSGKAKRRGLRWEMTHPKVQWLDEDESSPTGRVLPVYGLTEGVTQGRMRRLVQLAVEEFSQAVEEPLDPSFREQRNLLPIHEALQIIHSPPDLEALARARRRFIYQELLVLQLAVALRRRQTRVLRSSPQLPGSAEVHRRIRRLFQFELTADQDHVIHEIAQDMAGSVPMNRLLQGDVGSGKTVVAEYAMLIAVANGHQAVMMAPTDVLARQHARTLARDLAHSKVRIGLLTGSISAKERRETLASIAKGEVDLVVGTHAVINEQLAFDRLGLVVIDEQHKFGVRQRAALKDVALAPHSLVMTATPIPRTVSMTLFGDLDVSTIRVSPSGRQPVNTYVSADERRAQWWEFFRKKLREGRQGYVVAPLVDEVQDSEVGSVEQLFETLSNGELEAFRLDLLHGRMTSAEKEAAMQSFANGETQVLVATTVVEVGIDVPNATLMTIESGERFGLAALHQLRGRISRGSHPGFLCVFADPQSAESKTRLEAFSKTTDGFELAEVDFQMRGPGELFGTKQHGLPALLIADLQRDSDVLEEARRDAQDMLADHVDDADSALLLLLRKATALYGQALDLADVG